MTTPTPPPFSADTAGGSRLIGVNALQDVVNKLTDAVGKLANAATALASQNANGTTTTSFGGQTFTAGSFPKMMSAAPANGGPGGYAGSNVTVPAPMGGGANGMSPGQMAQSMAQSMFSGATGGGAGGLSNQLTMNQYAAMSSLGFAPGTNLGQGFAAMYSQAFGMYGKNLNAIAQNPADAAQMYSNLQGIAASPYVMSTALGQAGYGATAGFGYANPSLGGAGASAAAGQLYSGQTSMLMRMYGYGMTPRAGGGQANPLSMGQTIQGMLQRWYGTSSVKQSTLNAGLANNGRLQLNLQALGLNPSTMGPALQMYNKLFQQGMGAGQAQTLLNDAAQNKNYGNQGSAQKLLSDKYGIATSDLQKYKDTTAVGTSTTSGEMSGFDSAVSAATTTLQKFDTAISHLMGAGGGFLGKLAGYGSGLSGTSGSVGGMAGNLLSSGLSFGMGMLTRLGGAAGSGGAGGGASSQGGTPGSSSSGSMSRAVSIAIKDAESQLGKPYVWGGDNPAAGFDCSGLIEWAYQQAGIKLPRTSQEQWSALQNRSVPLGRVRAGDIVFAAGSDGTASSPGHEAMMVSGNQIIESPYTGANIRMRAYNPSEWQHAARPSGSLTGGGGGITGGTSGSNGVGSASTTTGQGNGGLGLSVGTYGSSNELQNVAAALLGSGLTGAGGFGGSSVGNGQGSGPTISAGGPSGAGAGAAMNIARKLAAAYGWSSGTQWNDLVQLWNDESGWRWNATNPTSGAYGIPQALPGSKMASAGADWRTNPATQEKWGLEYIRGRYGSPAGALGHEDAYHWYGAGTPGAQRGWAVVGDRGPELVQFAGGEQVANAAKTRDILTGQAAQAAQSAWSTGSAAKLLLAPVPQNSIGRSAAGGNCTVQLNMPPGAIVIHTQGSATDASNAVRQIMEGISQAMSENELIKQIMEGVMG